MPKRIILLLDGTWNDPDRGDTDTNIVRLRERIARHLERSPSKAKSYETSPSVASQQTVVMRGGGKDGGLENVILYERGVGTGGFFNNLKGGAFGAGLSNNVRRAYTFLAQNYEPDDQIYIFGFSRGSYTARSLVGCLSAVGLLRREKCDAGAVSMMWELYRTYPADRLPARTAELREMSYQPETGIRIKCLGVFDTVGALGIPLTAFWRENRDLFGFHDVGLSPICDHSLHAVAIDEHREAFEATLWRHGKFTATDQRAEQVWFAGSHGDVGGGYVVEETRGDRPYVDDLPLDWMIRRVQAIAEGDFPVGVSKPMSEGVGQAYVKAPHHEARRGTYCLFPFVFRSIGNQCIPVAPWPLERNVCYDRHAAPIGEGLHISAVLRLGQEIEIDSSPAKYVPRNLIAAIQHGVVLPVIGWDGEICDEKLSADLLRSGLSSALA
jgi:Uncharacterized alpha/beta hydrolase domain (DUF2235)